MDAAKQQQMQQMRLLQQIQRQKDAMSRFPSNIDVHLRPQNHPSLLNNTQQQNHQLHLPQPNPTTTTNLNPIIQNHNNNPNSNNNMNNNTNNSPQLLQQQQQPQPPPHQKAAMQLAYQDAWRVCHPDFKRPSASIADACERKIMPPDTKEVVLNPYFKKGTEIEISNNDEGFLGSWYRGTIIRVNRKSLEAVVEYKDLMDVKDERFPLREEIDLLHVRPPQPSELRPKFNVDEYVDAYYHDGWWEGIITGFIVGEDKYVVFFKHTREQRKFKASKLRLHREWVYGKWHPALDNNHDDTCVNQVPEEESPEVEVPAFKGRNIRSRDELHMPSKVPAFKKRKIRSRDELHMPSKVQAFKKRKIRSRDELLTPSKEGPLIDEMQSVPLSAESTPNKEQAKRDFRPGQLVEVSQEGEGFEGAWFTATIVKTLNADMYVIEYQDLQCDDNETPLTEEVDSQHMRPCPPEISIVDGYAVLEYVDAFYNDCWWSGVISKVLKDDRYSVYFSTFEEEMKFKHSQLRVHQKWINGQWVVPGKAVKL